jgi:thiol-disulfide isomerase/thioredoxin
MKIIVLIFPLLLLSGCLEEPLIKAEDIIEELPALKTFPDFEFLAHDNSTWNNSMFNGTPYIAYFSAAWCTHCESTLDAYDLAIPNDRFLVFNKDPTATYSNMTEWHENTEAGLNRTIDRPFMHAPNLSSTMAVTDIPSAYFINSEGKIVDSTIGLQTDVEALKQLWNATVNWASQ